MKQQKLTKWIRTRADAGPCYVGKGDAMRRLGITSHTLNALRKAGAITAFKTNGGARGQWRYDVDGYIAERLRVAKADLQGVAPRRCPLTPDMFHGATAQA